jgi:predicted dithiol-disulfide oxidoreductase (DUF899 family)
MPTATNNEAKIADQKIVSRAEWLAARRELLRKEKELTYLREKISEQRRKLPWERVEKKYVFDGPNGKETLADLFAGCSQLAMYHFMFAPGWVEGCKSCSYMADTFDGIAVHLAHRDVTFLAISRAPYAEIQKFQKRMGWNFKWVSSNNSDFNFDYNVSFTPEEKAKGNIFYNFDNADYFSEEGPGASVFYKNDAGEIFHTYSTYARGLDPLVPTYHWLDLVPKGRDEDGFAHTMAWVRHHDKYDDNYVVDAKQPYVEPARTGATCCADEKST